MGMRAVISFVAASMRSVPRPLTVGRITPANPHAELAINDYEIDRSVRSGVGVMGNRNDVPRICPATVRETMGTLPNR